jgi:hypothetical protein
MRSVRGNTAEGFSWIENGIRDTRATGVMLTVPFLLTLKAEAVHLAGRTVEAIEAIRRGTQWCKEKTAIGLPNCTWLRGVFLAASGADEPQIEASFQAASS